MNYIVTINNKKYEVEVEKGKASILSTTEVATPVIVPHSIPPASPAVIPGTVPAASSAIPAASTAGVGNGEAIKAPMPGTILNIKISEGVKVKKGDVLFILEAMKMENEIMAPKDGTVIQINTAKGSTVSTGDILAVIQQ